MLMVVRPGAAGCGPGFIAVMDNFDYRVAYVEHLLSLADFSDDPV